MAYVVSALRKNGTSTFLCASPEMALAHVWYFEKRCYAPISIVAPDGKPLTIDGLLHLVSLDTPGDLIALAA